MNIKFKYSNEHEKNQIIKNNSSLFLVQEGIEKDGNYLVFSDVPLEIKDVPHEPTEIEIMQNKISILEAENEKLKIEQEQQNEEILVNMLAITEMYELNRSFAVSTVESSSRSKVPTYIQATYQKLYELKVKTIEEIPSEVRENIKNI